MSQAKVDAAVLADSRRYTRRSSVVAAAGAVAGYSAYRWIDGATQSKCSATVREAFQTNAAIVRTFTHDRALAPTYTRKEAKDLRINGVYGLKRMLVAESWRLQFVGSSFGPDHRRFSPAVTAWEYKYVDSESHEDQGHDTKIDPNARTAEKMAPEPMLNQAKTDEERTGRMPRGQEEAGESRSALPDHTPGLLLTMERHPRPSAP